MVSWICGSANEKYPKNSYSAFPPPPPPPPKPSSAEGQSREALNSPPVSIWGDDKQQSEDEEEEGPYELPKKTQRKMQKQEKLRKKIIEGAATSKQTAFKGAPEPSRDLFIYRVQKDTSAEALKAHLADLRTDGKMTHPERTLACISKDEATFRSFKLTVAVSDFSRLMDGNVWPHGVRVRRFFTPRQKHVGSQQNAEDHG